jgi:hypothetical protein
MSTIKDVEYNEEAFCEHCYELEPYTATIEDGAMYCIDCAVNSDDVELSEEDLKVIEITETLYKVKYFEKRHVSNLTRLADLIKDADKNLVERLKEIPPIGDLE